MHNSINEWTIVYQAYDNSSSLWVLMSTPVNPMNTSALAHIPGMPYNTGDVVSEIDGNGFDCCFVCVWGADETTGIASNWILTPNSYYTLYVRYYNAYAQRCFYPRSMLFRKAGL